MSFCCIFAPIQGCSLFTVYNQSGGLFIFIPLRPEEIRTYQYVNINVALFKYSFDTLYSGLTFIKSNVISRAVLHVDFQPVSIVYHRGHTAVCVPEERQPVHRQSGTF